MSSGVERCRGVSSGVEGCRGVSRCRVWHLDTDEHGPSLDGVEGCEWCRGVSRGVELVELAWGVEVSSRCRGLVSRCRGQGSDKKSAVREPWARRRRDRCHGGSRWRPSPGSLAQPTTLRDRRPIVMSLSRTGAPLEVMFIDSKALLIAKGGKGTLDPHACNPRAAAHHCSARDTVAGPTPIAIHRRT